MSEGRHRSWHISHRGIYGSNNILVINRYHAVLSSHRDHPGTKEGLTDSPFYETTACVACIALRYVCCVALHCVALRAWMRGCVHVGMRTCTCVWHICGTLGGYCSATSAAESAASSEVKTTGVFSSGKTHFGYNQISIYRRFVDIKH